MNEFSNVSYGLVRMKPLIYIVRHGSTVLNESGKFRGFMDVPLDEKGIKQAKQNREALSGVNISHAYSSDLKRAIKTKEIILQGHGPYMYDSVPSKALSGMRPWNVGEFAGQIKNEENKKKLQSYADNPDEVVPGGESLNSFRDRYKKVFDKVLAEASSSKGPSLMAQHASNCHEVGNILYGDIDALDIEPGGIIVVSRLGGKLVGTIFKGAETGDHSETVS